MKKTLLAMAATIALSGCDKVDDPTLYPEFKAATAKPEKPNPATTANNERNLYWGDLHIHSSNSYDAYTTGVRATADDAYTYMKGGEIKHGMGYAIQASKALDFGAVTDHSEYLGVARELDTKDRAGKHLREVMLSGSPLRMSYNWLATLSGSMTDSETRFEAFGSSELKAVSMRTWADIVAAAERHNEPGVFTAFVAYEWTSMPNEDNLHRNVIYRSASAPRYPYSSLDSDNPEDLWRALDEQRAKGMDAMAIPHNSNVSNGLMYSQTNFNGDELDAEYASLRVRNEPISEMIQIKGNSETHPELSPDDEFADFEVVSTKLSADGARSEPKGSYVRDALRTGLELSQQRGFNPYVFGFIGSSDSHNASFSVEENNFHGKLPLLDGSAGLRNGASILLPDEYNRGAKWSAQGLAAVWAEENTRESLFDAMRRRETYATSGTRISLRVFGGWELPSDLLERSDRLAVAYKTAVPMGGVLRRREPTVAPQIAVWASRDPEGANLDRIQMVKGWVDSKGDSWEKVFNIKGSGGREVNEDGTLSPVGNTVDVANASYSNTIGDSQLAVLWQDPEFDPTQRAFYYARVLEIPTPRYSTFDAKALKLEPKAPVAIQERAMSSAIWYTPSQ